MKNNVTEADIQQGILQYLTLRFPHGYFKRQNTLPIPIRMKVNGVWQITGFRKARDAGTSDIIGCLKGRFVAIEVKRTKRDKPSPDQQKFLDDINAAGGIGFVARSIDDVRENLG